MCKHELFKKVFTFIWFEDLALTTFAITAA